VGAVVLTIQTSATYLAAQSPGFWEQRTALATARQEVAAAVLNGQVYVGGGLALDRSALKTVERYDPKTKKWTSVASMPTTLHHFGMAAAGGKIYAIGGYVSSFVGTNKCSVYDPTNNKWSAIANLPRARGALAAATINGKIYAVGGVVPSVGVVGDLTVYDPTNNKWSTLTSMPTTREHLAVAALGGKLYAAGGRRGGNFKILEVYDPTTNKWTRLKDMPTARGGNGAAALNGKLIVVGGESPGVFRQTEEYDPKTNTWRSLELMSTGLHGIYPVTIGDEIMVAGGGFREGFGASNIVISLRMFPDGVNPYGTGTASCTGNVVTYVTHRPIPGETRFSIVSDNGPPGTSGFFAVGMAADVTGSTILGFRTHLDLNKPIVLFAVNSNASGRSTLNVPVPKSATGLSAFSQFVWANTQGCGGQGTVSSSHGLSVAVR
ncbi:MAG: Kelch repeat-containing protein, partial [Planctomycetota bacterium]